MSNLTPKTNYENVKQQPSLWQRIQSKTTKTPYYALQPGQINIEKMSRNITKPKYQNFFKGEQGQKLLQSNLFLNSQKAQNFFKTEQGLNFLQKQTEINDKFLFLPQIQRALEPKPNKVPTSEQTYNQLDFLKAYILIPNTNIRIFDAYEYFQVELTPELIEYLGTNEGKKLIAETNDDSKIFWTILDGFCAKLYLDTIDGYSNKDIFENNMNKYWNNTKVGKLFILFDNIFLKDDDVEKKKNIFTNSEKDDIKKSYDEFMDKGEYKGEFYLQSILFKIYTNQDNYVNQLKNIRILKYLLDLTSEYYKNEIIKNEKNNNKIKFCIDTFDFLMNKLKILQLILSSYYKCYNKNIINNISYYWEDKIETNWNESPFAVSNVIFLIKSDEKCKSGLNQKPIKPIWKDWWYMNFYLETSLYDVTCQYNHDLMAGAGIYIRKGPRYVGNLIASRFGLTNGNNINFNIISPVAYKTNFTCQLSGGSKVKLTDKRTFYFEHGGKQSKIKAEKPKKAAEKVYKKTKAEKITVKDKKTGKKYHYTLEKNGELKNKK